jgi:hypothetical protein
MFTQQDYSKLSSIVFQPGYPGYKPEVIEIPNGDGKADADKRYAHIATKYLNGVVKASTLRMYLTEAHDQAVHVAELLEVPEEFMPVMEYGALRILEYPPGAVSHEHQDFDLFTLMLYRDQPDKFISDWHDMPENVRKVNAQCHMGQLGEYIGLGSATSHSVLPSETPQHSIVYFAIPNHHAMLSKYDLDGDPDLTVREWLNERMKRSRTAFDEYK